MADIKKKDLDVHLMHITPNAERILSFAKDTRLMGEGRLVPQIAMMERPMDEVMENVKYSLNTVRGPLEFIHFIFLITDASRALTHQVVRHRVNSYAQQSLRVSDNVGYYHPPGIKRDSLAGHTYEAHILNAKTCYDDLRGMGIETQDARGVLPLHVTSAIMMKINLRALLELFEIRLCLRVQGEHRDMARLMAKSAIGELPWVSDHVGPLCGVKGICAFPRYNCPISRTYPALKGLPSQLLGEIRSHVGKFGSKGLSVGTQNK